MPADRDHIWDGSGLCTHEEYAQISSPHLVAEADEGKLFHSHYHEAKKGFSYNRQLEYVEFHRQVCLVPSLSGMVCVLLGMVWEDLENGNMSYA
jgi:hypothetical protein